MASKNVVCAAGAAATPTTEKMSDRNYYPRRPCHLLARRLQWSLRWLWLRL